jgi:hypothetical protein
MRKSICLIGGLVTVGSGGFLPLSGLCEQQPTWRFGVLGFLTVIEGGLMKLVGGVFVANPALSLVEMGKS